MELKVLNDDNAAPSPPNQQTKTMAVVPEEISPAEQNKSTFEICGVTKKTTIAARILIFIFIVIVMTSLLLLIPRKDGQKILEQFHLNVIEKNAWSTEVLGSLEEKKKDFLSKKVYINATSTELCRKELECVKILQSLESQGQSFKCNFLISSYGDIFEDSGWTSSNITIVCFIGSFRKLGPSSRSMQALELLLEDGVNSNHLEIGYKLFANKNFPRLSSEMEKSPHWNSIDKFLFE